MPTFTPNSDFLIVNNDNKNKLTFSLRPNFEININIK